MCTEICDPSELVRHLVEVLRPGPGDGSVDPPDLNLAGRAVVHHLAAATGPGFRRLVFGRDRKVGHPDHHRSGPVFEVRVIGEVVNRLLGDFQLLGPDQKHEEHHRADP